MDFVYTHSFRLKIAKEIRIEKYFFQQIKTEPGLESEEIYSQSLLSQEYFVNNL